MTEFDDQITKEGLIGTFCALLELIKLGVVTAVQDHPRAEIEVALCEKVEGDIDELMRASTFMDETPEEEPEEENGEGEEGEDVGPAHEESPEQAPTSPADAADPAMEAQTESSPEVPQDASGTENPEHGRPSP